MFGFKIIREHEYKILMSIYDTYQEYGEEKEADIKKLESDINSLRQQNSDLRKAVNNLQNQVYRLSTKNDKHLARINKLLGKLKDQADVEFEVMTEPTLCDLCKHEFKNCKKLSVGDTTVCVVPKIPFPAE